MSRLVMVDVSNPFSAGQWFAEGCAAPVAVTAMMFQTPSVRGNGLLS